MPCAGANLDNEDRAGGRAEIAREIARRSHGRSRGDRTGDRGRSYGRSHGRSREIAGDHLCGIGVAACLGVRAQPHRHGNGLELFNVPAKLHLGNLRLTANGLQLFNVPAKLHLGNLRLIFK